MECFLDLPWNIIDTLINFAELLVICVPATVVFLYYRIHSVTIWTLEATDVGATLLVHNKKNKSIFITAVNFLPLKNSDFGNPVVAYNKTVTQLKPDEYLEVVVNYTKQSKGKQAFKLIVQYNQQKKKSTKVKI